MNELRKAVFETDFKDVYRTLLLYKSQLQPINHHQLFQWFEKGIVYWDEGVAVVLRPLARKRSHLGFVIPPETYQIVAIASSRQRKGAADAVMQRLLWTAHGRVILSVYPFNVRAIRFYRKHGFVKLGEYQYPTFMVDVMFKGHFDPEKQHANIR